MMYDSWDMLRDRQNFFWFWTIFCPFTPPPHPPNNPEHQNFGKMKKIPRDIIIIHRCTINENHMIYGSWDRKCKRIFLSSCTTFCLFTPPPPPISPRNKNLKKIKKTPFYTSAPKIMIIGYTVPEIWHMTDVIVIFHFGLFFFF